MSARVFQANFQQVLGGGEVYTAFLCRALSQLGVSTQLLVHPQAGFWRDLPLPADTVLVPIDIGDVMASMRSEPKAWLLSHGALPPELLASRPAGLLATAIAHMPVQDQGSAALVGYDRVFAVSNWVLAGLRQAGLNAWDTPLYGVADLARPASGSELIRSSCYSWDPRKFRDRLLGWVEPCVESLRFHPPYARRTGLTLGIVSRLTPIKQFPELFDLLVPTLRQTPDVMLEIFGSGGYASVRDLKRALAPLGERVRFWGHQQNVMAAYGGIDYLVTGLPEKEALGLNVIEAQACGTPVLAPSAPPFTETVADGITGYLYRDPREDAGVDFARLMTRLESLPFPLDPRQATEHLAIFSFDAFVERLRPVVDWALNVKK
jgi:glycosyltransferase involved in cell wall biosynthesis